MKKFQLTIFYLQRAFLRLLKKSTSFSFRSSPKTTFQTQDLPRKILPDLKYLIVFIFLVLGVIFFWKSPVTSSEPQVSEGFIGVYTLENLPSLVTTMITKPLINMDKSGSPQPNLVSGWIVDDKSQVYTFKLKDQILWHDQSKVSSSHFRFNLPDVETSYPNETSIEFKLAETFSPFPSLLTAPIFKSSSLVGTGDFKVKETIFNGDFIKTLTLTPLNMDAPEVVIKFYPDEKTAKTAFGLGEVDSLVGINDQNILNQPSIKVKSVTDYTKLVAIFYDLGDPVLSDENIRHALTFSTPIIEGEERAETSIPPFSWAFNQEIKDNLENPDKAKGYLKKVPNIKDKTITLTTTPSLSQAGEKIVQAWKNIGINAVLRVESGVPQKFQALLIIEAIPQDPDQYLLWHSTQSKFNISTQPFAPRVDRDLEEGRKTSDIEKRKEYYLDFQKVLADNSVATFLYFPKFHIVYRQKAESNINKILPFQLNLFNN